MIKSENGRALTADRYTQLWHTALAKPFALPGVTYAFEQKVFEDSFSSKAIDAPGILRQHGFEADAAQLERLDIVALSLFEHGEALDAMCHANGKYNSLFLCRTLPARPDKSFQTQGLPTTAVKRLFGETQQVKRWHTTSASTGPCRSSGTNR
mgnify:CR=1 FL=1